MFRPEHSHQPDAAFLRSCALDVLIGIRDIRNLRKEQLFADAIAFYRWYFTTVQDESELDIYIEMFAEAVSLPARTEDEGLRDALFITWFVDQGYHQLPLLSQEPPVIRREQ